MYRSQGTPSSVVALENTPNLVSWIISLDDKIFLYLYHQIAYYTPTTGFVYLANYCSDLGGECGFYPLNLVMVQSNLVYWANDGLTGVNIYISNLTSNSGELICKTNTCNSGILPQGVGQYLMFFNANPAALYSLSTSSIPSTQVLVVNLANLNQSVITGVPDIWEPIGNNQAYFLTSGTSLNNSNCVYLWSTNGVTAQQYSVRCNTTSTTKMTGGWLKSFPYSPDGVNTYTVFSFQSILGSSITNASFVHVNVFNTANHTWFSGSVPMCVYCNGTSDYTEVFSTFMWYFSEFGLRMFTFGALPDLSGSSAGSSIHPLGILGILFSLSLVVFFGF